MHLLLSGLWLHEQIISFGAFCNCKMRSIPIQYCMNLCSGFLILTESFAHMQAVNVAPTLISISATGINIQPEGVNVAPDLIVVGPYDTTVAGQVSWTCPFLRLSERI